MLYWTPPARHQGTPPWRGQHLWPWGLLQASSYFYSGVTASSLVWQHCASQPNSKGGQHSYYLTNLDSWGWHRHSPWGGDSTSRGDEQGHGVLVYDQGVHGCSSRKQVSEIEMTIHQNEAEATQAIRRPTTSQLLGMQRPTAPQLLGRWRATAPQLLWR